MYKITSFTSHPTAEGERLSFTYSEIDENGMLIRSNERANVILLDDAMLDHVKALKAFLLSKIN